MQSEPVRAEKCCEEVNRLFARLYEDWMSGVQRCGPGEQDEPLTASPCVLRAAPRRDLFGFVKSRKSTRNLRLTNCKAQVGSAQKGEQAMISPSKTKGEISMTFADNLVRLRREKGFSQEQLADLMDVSRQAVSKWEAGVSQS